MVSKITIFETHFEDVQFGPAKIESGPPDEQDQAESDESKSPAVMFLQGATVFVVMFVVLWVVFSRLLSDDETDGE